MWNTARRAVDAWRDEDIAMSSRNFGTFYARNDAHTALICAVEAEIREWNRYYEDRGYGKHDDARLQLIRTELLEHPEKNSVVVDGLEFCIFEF